MGIGDNYRHEDYGFLIIDERQKKCVEVEGQEPLYSLGMKLSSSGMVRFQVV